MILYTRHDFTVKFLKSFWIIKSKRNVASFTVYCIWITIKLTLIHSHMWWCFRLVATNRLHTLDRTLGSSDHPERQILAHILLFAILPNFQLSLGVCFLGGLCCFQLLVPILALRFDWWEAKWCFGGKIENYKILVNFWELTVRVDKKAFARASFIRKRQF